MRRIAFHLNGTKQHVVALLNRAKKKDKGIVPTVCMIPYTVPLTVEECYSFFYKTSNYTVVILKNNCYVWLNQYPAFHANSSQ